MTIALGLLLLLASPPDRPFPIRIETVASQTPDGPAKAWVARVLPERGTDRLTAEARDGRRVAADPASRTPWPGWALVGSEPGTRLVEEGQDRGATARPVANHLGVRVSADGSGGPPK